MQIHSWNLVLLGRGCEGPGSGGSWEHSELTGKFIMMNRNGELSALPNVFRGLNSNVTFPLPLFFWDILMDI